MAQVIVLTGGNKGIGKGIAYALLRESPKPITLILTARSPKLGEAAVAEIKAAGLPKPGSSLLFHQLDITSQSSAEALASDIKEQHGHVDILINNAGILPAEGSKFDLALVEETVGCNYTGPKRVTEAIFPLMKKGGRVVYVSSNAGDLAKIKKESLRKELSDRSLTIEGLEALKEKSFKAVADGTYEEMGWADNAYWMSKAFNTALSMVHARAHPELLVNACHPGWVKTDMAPMGPLTIEQGVRTPVKLAIGDIGTTTEKMWKDEQVIDW